LPLLLFVFDLLDDSFVFGSTEGTKDFDLLFVPDKFLPQFFGFQKAHIPAGSLGAFGP